MTDNVLIEQTYRATHKFSDHAENEVSPEYVQTEKDQQHHIEEVVAKEGRVVLNRVDPGTVDEPENTAEEKQVKISNTQGSCANALCCVLLVQMKCCWNIM